MSAPETPNSVTDKQTGDTEKTHSSVMHHYTDCTKPFLLPATKAWVSMGRHHDGVAGLKFVPNEELYCKCTVSTNKGDGLGETGHTHIRVKNWNQP